MKKILLAAAVSACLSACVSVPLVPPALASKVQFSDDSVQVVDIRESAAPDGTPKVVVRGRLLSKFDQVVRYRLRWYDVNDTPINTALDNWLELSVAGDAPFEFVAVGPGARAKRFVVEFEPR